MWFNEPMWLKCDVCLLGIRVAAVGPEAVERIIKTIAVIDDFCHANDPYEEHDFGSFEVDGHRDLFSRSITPTRPSRATHPIRLILPSPSA
jgi:Protein of unknown function (DUF3768)